MSDLNPYDWFAGLAQTLGLIETTQTSLAAVAPWTLPIPIPRPTPSPAATPTANPYANLGQAAAGPLTPAGTTGSAAPTVAPNMAFPFPSSYFNPSDLTEKFGQSGPGGSTEMGNDYAMPVGTPIYAPFDGTIGVEDQGKRNWGKRIFLTGPNGVIFAVGHLHEFAVTTGSVHAGQIIGYSGGATSDSSSGNSTGPHVELQILRPQAGGHYQYVDPAPWLTGVFSGNPVAIAGLPGGTATEPQQPAGSYITPDGHYIVPGTQDDRFYKMADSIWTKVYASHPPWSVVQALLASGVQNTDQLTAVLNGLPSHVPGWTIGKFETMSSAANSLANKFFGRPVPDSLMKQFAAQGIDTPDQVQLWFMNHSASQIPKEDYQAIFDLANVQTNAVWGVPPHPDQVAAIHQQTVELTPGGKVQQEATLKKLGRIK